MEATTAGEAPVINFAAAAIPPTAFFMGDNDIRYYLNGLYVTPHPTAPGCIVVGCDGHRLAMYYDKDGTCSTPTILKVNNELIAACKKRAAKVRVLGERRVMLEGGRLVLKEVGEMHATELFVQAGAEQASDGKPYPNIWNVIPKPEALVPGLHGCINAKYFQELGQAAKLLPNAFRHHNSLDHYSRGSDGNGCILTRYALNPDFIVITMTMRGYDNDEYPRKEMLPPVIAEAVAAKAA